MPEEKKQSDEVEKIRGMMIETFSTPAGKRTLEYLERISFMNRTTMPVQGLPDTAMRLAFNEGCRFMVVNIKNIMGMKLEELRKLSQTQGE
jgi:hypothetical protein